MLTTNALIVLVAAASGVTAHASDGQQSDRSQDTRPEPTFLLSERNLGSEGKICFLSNGLQIRITAAQVCPYALKAPPFVEQSQKPVPSTQPSIIQNPSIDPKPTLEANSAKQSALRSPPSQPAAQSKVSRPTPTQPALQNLPSTGQGQRLKPETAASPKNDTKSGLQTNSIETSQGRESLSPESEDDEIAAKAIRRCERIGFAQGSEPFKSCALEQIRLITVAKP